MSHIDSKSLVAKGPLGDHVLHRKELSCIISRLNTKLPLHLVLATACSVVVFFILKFEEEAMTAKTTCNVHGFAVVGKLSKHGKEVYLGRDG